MTAKRRGPFRRYFYEHPLAMDLVIVAIYLLGSASTVITQLLQGHPLHLLLSIVSAGLLMFRRHRPVAVIALLTVIETALLVLEPLASNASMSLWFGLYAVAVQHRRRVSFAITAAVSLSLVVVLLFFFQVPPQVAAAGGVEAALAGVVTAVVVVLSNVIATGVGISVRRDREHEGELRAWAERNAQLASVSERNRIAREMHDVVAHSLTVMIALSDGAAVVVRRDPGRAAEVLAELSQTGRTALGDMRRVLGVLRQDSSTGPAERGPLGRQPLARAPLPAQSGLEVLLDGFRTAGLPLSVTTRGPALPADPAFQLTVYRIIQESLTNVLRYGHGVSRVLVQVLHQDPEIRLRISDDGHGSMAPAISVGSGQGLVGMRERAGIYAGTVTAGPGADGGWVVEAVLSCPAHAGAGTDMDASMGNGTGR
ncbi:MAG: histidine kinase [Actinomycetota bacterium]|nr:histidine kinase [Actinomycetota bacterium]